MEQAFQHTQTMIQELMASGYSEDRISNDALVNSLIVRQARDGDFSKVNASMYDRIVRLWSLNTPRGQSEGHKYVRSEDEPSETQNEAAPTNGKGALVNRDLVSVDVEALRRVVDGLIEGFEESVKVLEGMREEM